MVFPRGAPLASSGDVVELNEDELICYYAVKYVLNKHELEIEDINFASNYICSFYDHSCQVDGCFTYDNLIQFLVYANTETICKFALSYNEALDLIIKTRDLGAFKELLLGPREMFVELYDNPGLTREAFNHIQQLVDREFKIVRLELSFLREKINHQDIINDFKQSDQCHSIEIDAQSDGGHLTVLMNKCYNDVCFSESLDPIQTSFSKSEVPSNNVYTIDQTVDQGPQIFCFKLFDLLKLISQPIPINPQTKQPFSQYSLKLIKQRFHKEIAMYQRYQQLSMLP